MYCYKCGKEIEDNSKFCSHCGNKLQENIERKQKEENIVADRHERKKQHREIAIPVVIILCVLALCIILGCIFLLFGKNKAKTKDYSAKEDTEQRVKETDFEEQTEYPPDTETQEEDDWKQAYIDYINPKELFEKSTGGYYTERMDENSYKDSAYALLDLNQDGIPEVFCCYDYDTASSGIVLSYDKESGSVVENSVRRYLRYNGTELWAENAFGGVLNATVYSLKNGRLQEEFYIGWQYDGETTYYMKDDVEITEEEYEHFEESYSEPIEMEFTYGEIIREIREYNGN